MVEALERALPAARRSEHLCDSFAVGGLLQLGLAFHRLLQRHRMGGILRHQLGELSTWPSGISSTRPTLRKTPRARNEPKVMICATRSSP